MADFQGLTRSIIDEIHSCLQKHGKDGCPSLAPVSSSIAVKLMTAEPSFPVILDEMVEAHSLMRLCPLSQERACLALLHLDCAVRILAEKLKRRDDGG